MCNLLYVISLFFKIKLSNYVYLGTHAEILHATHKNPRYIILSTHRNIKAKPPALSDNIFLNHKLLHMIRKD